MRVPASGGVPRQVTEPDAGRKEMSHGNPQFLPDGKHFLYFIGSSDPEVQGVYAGSLDSPKDRVRILTTDRKAYFARSLAGSNGFLLWLREQTLLAQPFDPGRLRLEGEPAPVAEDVGLGPSMRSAFWVSDSGLLVYRTGDSGSSGKLVWMSRDGKRLGEAVQEGRYGSFRLSPDGKRVALSREDDTGNIDLWVLELDRQIMTRLTFDSKHDGIPVWSPDGRQIVFFSERSGIRQLYRKDAGGAGQEEQITTDPIRKTPHDWSRDGRYLLFGVGEGLRHSDIWTIPIEGGRLPEAKRTAVLATSFSEGVGQISPDGKWLAYESDESSRSEVYVQAFPVASGRWQVSNQGGSSPKWRADGKELFYLSLRKNSLIAAGIRIQGASLQSDTPRELFSIPPVSARLASPFESTADGQRFLVYESKGRPDAAPLTVVTNWQALLKR